MHFALDITWRGVKFRILTEFWIASEAAQLHALDLFDPEAAMEQRCELVASKIKQVFLAETNEEVETDPRDEAEGFGLGFIEQVYLAYLVKLNERISEILPALDRWSQWTATKECCYGWDKLKKEAYGCGSTCKWKGSTCPGKTGEKFIWIWELDRDLESGQASKKEIVDWQQRLVNSYRTVHFDEMTRKEREAKATREIKEQIRGKRK